MCWEGEEGGLLSNSRGDGKYGKENREMGENTKKMGPAKRRQLMVSNCWVNKRERREKERKREERERERERGKRERKRERRERKRERER